MNKKSRNIGIEVMQVPTQGISTDKHDPFFSSLSLRGMALVGNVISSKAARTVKIELERLFPLPKYERFEKRRTRLLVHNPDSVNAQVGDIVKVMECRPISKTKNFVIIEVVKKHESA